MFCVPLLRTSTSCVHLVEISGAPLADMLSVCVCVCMCEVWVVDQGVLFTLKLSDKCCSMPSRATLSDSSDSEYGGIR